MSVCLCECLQIKTSKHNHTLKWIHIFIIVYSLNLQNEIFAPSMVDMYSVLYSRFKKNKIKNSSIFPDQIHTYITVKKTPTNIYYITTAALLL